MTKHDEASDFADLMAGIFSQLGWETSSEKTDEGTKYTITPMPLDTNTTVESDEQKEGSDEGSRTPRTD